MVKAEAESLANSVKRTSNLSERVSRKVRELDTAQSRINGTLESIDYIVNRTNAVDGVQQALQTEDYEAAAQYVSTLLQSEDKYGKVHQDSSIKQSEQQSRVSKRTSCLTDHASCCCHMSFAWPCPWLFVFALAPVSVQKEASVRKETCYLGADTCGSPAGAKEGCTGTAGGGCAQAGT